LTGIFIDKFIQNEGGKDFYFAEFKEPPIKEKKLQIISTIHICSPRQHGIIHKSPNSLAEIAQFVKYDEVDTHALKCVALI